MSSQELCDLLAIAIAVFETKRNEFDVSELKAEPRRTTLQNSSLSQNNLERYFNVISFEQSTLHHI
jgi:hypothetical protein